MIHSQIDEDGHLHWLTCDNCGEDLLFQYETRLELVADAFNGGWRHNASLRKHFCTLACELEYLAKLAEKGGER